MQNKKGISLIVLIITIIVIIILAGAVILSLSNTKIIENAQTAVEKSDLDAAQSAYVLWLGNEMAEKQDSLSFSTEAPVDITNESTSIAVKDKKGTLEAPEDDVSATFTLSDLGLTDLSKKLVKNTPASKKLQVSVTENIIKYEYVPAP